MNQRLTSLLLAIPFAAALAAQQDPADAMPNPKTPQHERLATLVGTWRTETKMVAMPGVPGMEEPSEMTGIEHAELVCNGLWLKVSGEGTCGGQACECLWLLGYDPQAKSYQCLVVSSMDEAACCIEGSHDGQKTWHFRGESPMGAFRSEFVMENPDRSVEVGYTKDKDGKEIEFMRSVRTRVKGSIPVDAAAKPASAVAATAAARPAPLAVLLADAGTWDADFRMEMPGAPAMTSKCREVVAPICGGMWTWSVFTGEMMGAPFEGHGLAGYDSKAGKVVSFWIDSMNGAHMRTDGTYDADKQVFTMSGTCYDEKGVRGPVSSVTTVGGKDSRQMRMVFGEGEGQHVMTIAYRRAGK
ncbi:MAG TPA: DUF1579 family protein [Planctomycetota bacterium]|nr:DUF1579 family protein [Planctomycetota bacterium]